MANYSDLLNVDWFWEKRVTFNDERWWVAFYCKDCEQLVTTTRKKPNKYIFTCDICWGVNIAVWTESGLKENYRMK